MIFPLVVVKHFLEADVTHDFLVLTFFGSDREFRIAKMIVCPFLMFITRSFLSFDLYTVSSFPVHKAKHVLKYFTAKNSAIRHYTFKSIR